MKYNAIIMATMDKLIDIAIGAIVYFSIFAAIVTAVNTTNWTALSLTWVPTVVFILLAISPVIALVYVFKKKK